MSDVDEAMMTWSNRKSNDVRHGKGERGGGGANTILKKKMKTATVRRYAVSSRCTFFQTSSSSRRLDSGQKWGKA